MTHFIEDRLSVAEKEVEEGKQMNRRMSCDSTTVKSRVEPLLKPCELLHFVVTTFTDTFGRREHV